MDVERLLISKIIDDRDITAVAEGGIKADFFTKDENRRVFETILRHRSEYGEVPSLTAIKLDFPEYKFLKVDDSVHFLVEQLRTRRATGIIEGGLEEASELWKQKKIKEAQGALSETLGLLGSELPSTKDTDLTATGEERLERYRSYKDFENGMRGIPTGFKSLDRATLGYTAGQLVTFIGPPKAGKSTLMVLAARAAHAYGAKPLFVGFEMTNEEQEERFDSIEAGVSHHRLRSGQLTKEEWERLTESIHCMGNMKPFILSSDIASATTLTGVSAKIDTVKPDILIVDGVYMMDDEYGERKGSPQALTNLTRGFKKLAMNRSIPIVISTQALAYKISKKHGLTADAIGYSSSFAQDSDVIIGVNKTEDEEINEVSIVLGRNAAKVRTYVHWDWETGRFEELDDNPFTFN